MAQIVYTSINELSMLASAVWSSGDQESYARTQQMAERFTDGRVQLIGRLDSRGNVQIVKSRCVTAMFKRWFDVNGFHLELARYFDNETWHESIDEESVRFAARQLCSVAEHPNEVSLSVASLGVSGGDRIYIPIAAASGAAH